MTQEPAETSGGADSGSQPVGSWSSAWSIPLSVPSVDVDVPVIEVPHLDVPVIELPQIDLPSLQGAPDLAAATATVEPMALPALDDPDAGVTQPASMGDVRDPDLAASTAVVNTGALPALDDPDAGVTQPASIGDVRDPDLAASTAVVDPMALPNLDNPDFVVTQAPFSAPVTAGAAAATQASAASRPAPIKPSGAGPAATKSPAPSPAPSQATRPQAARPQASPAAVGNVSWTDKAAQLSRSGVPASQPAAAAPRAPSQAPGLQRPAAGRPSQTNWPASPPRTWPASPQQGGLARASDAAEGLARLPAATAVVAGWRLCDRRGRDRRRHLLHLRDQPAVAGARPRSGHPVRVQLGHSKRMASDGSVG